MNGGHRRPVAPACAPAPGPVPGLGPAPQLLPPPPQFAPQQLHHPQLLHQQHLLQQQPQAQIRSPRRQQLQNQQQQQHHPPEMPPNQIAQVIALICGILVVILMALGLGSADWLMAAGWRQGLFTHCIEPDAPTPLPFNLIEQPGCYRSRDVAYIRAAAGLCIVTLCTDIIGTLLTALGLRATEHHTKYKYYRLAVLAMAVALIAILIALVIYPVCFAAELNLGNRTVWEFGWAYGVGWGAAIFLFGAVILLLCDKESEEIYFKERKVEREPPGGP